MTYDLISDQLIVGEIGSNLHEEINVIEAGANYGWACTEGTDTSATYPCFSSPTDPLFSFDRNEFKSITGGYIYRGSNNPSLYGKYIFGDFNSKKLCYLDESEVKCWDHTNSLIDYNIVTFGVDVEDEIHAADHLTGNIFKLSSESVDCSIDTLSVTTNNSQVYFANKLVNLSNVSYQYPLYINSPEVVFDTLFCSNSQLLLNEFDCIEYSTGITHFNQN